MSEAGSDKIEPLKPYIPADESPRELTVRALVLGSLLSILFGMVNAYAGLKIGLTVSSSIPAAILSMSVLRGILGREPPAWLGPIGRGLFGRATILENNTAHAVASTGESLASGVIFTVPALMFLARDFHRPGPSQTLIFLLGLSGGLLGLLMMIPLRRYLMVDEHAVLPFPEGTACAKVLIVGDKGGRRAIPVLIGGVLGGLYDLSTDLFSAFRDTVTWTAARLHQATISFQFNPLMLGVGYLIGLETSLVFLYGGIVGWVLLIPFFDWLATSGAGTSLAHWLAVAPGSLGPDDTWSNYVRYVGAGGVAFGGFLSLGRALPSIGRSFASGIRGFSRAEERGPRERTDRDLPLPFVVVGVVAVALGLWLIPPFELGPLEAFLALVFSFFFVVVASRLVGLIGSTSQPVSGMTIAALLSSCFIISHVRGTGPGPMFAAMTAGTVVCVAICLATDLSQDLKTCTLLGGTPWVVQSGQILGTLSAALRAGFVLLLLDTRYHLGSPALPAPQATLMATLVHGTFGGHLPWGLLAIGAVLALGAELIGWGGLAFSIGLYLPVATSASFIFGGLIAWALRKRHSKESFFAADEKATLFSSGLIAGYALLGIAVAFIGVAADQAAAHPAFTPFAWIMAHVTVRSTFNLGALEDLITIVPFALLALLLWRVANRPETG